MGEDLISSEVQQLFEVFIVQCALIVATRTTVFTVALLLLGRLGLVFIPMYGSMKLAFLKF